MPPMPQTDITISEWTLDQLVAMLRDENTPSPKLTLKHGSIEVQRVLFKDKPCIEKCYLGNLSSRQQYEIFQLQLVGGLNDVLDYVASLYSSENRTGQWGRERVARTRWFGHDTSSWQRLAEGDNSPFKRSVPTLLAWVRGVLRACETFHRLGFVHCDLVSPNIVLRHRLDPRRPGCYTLLLDQPFIIDLEFCLSPQHGDRVVKLVREGWKWNDGRPFCLNPAFHSEFICAGEIVKVTDKDDDFILKRVHKKDATGRVVVKQAPFEHLPRVDWGVDLFSLGVGLQVMLDEADFRGPHSKSHDEAYQYLEQLPRLLRSFNQLAPDTKPRGNMPHAGICQRISELIGTLGGNECTIDLSHLFAQVSRPANPVPALAPKQVIQDGPDCPNMVVIPGGEFMMGSPESEAGRRADEGPQHRVRVEKFLIGQTAVTVAEFRRFVKATGYQTEAELNVGEGAWAMDASDGKWSMRAGRSWHNPGWDLEDMQPVTCVSWNDANAYIAWLSELTKQAYQLPTEAQWEYAARAGTTTSRYWGDDPNKASLYANARDQTLSPGGVRFEPRHECKSGYFFVAPVARFRPNNFGLYDMLGNVWEWTADRYSSNEYKYRKDSGIWPASKINNAFMVHARVLRGGSWYDIPQYVRAAFRYGDGPRYRGVNLGFRLARMLPPQFPDADHQGAATPLSQPTYIRRDADILRPGDLYLNPNLEAKRLAEEARIGAKTSGVSYGLAYTPAHRPQTAGELIHKLDEASRFRKLEPIMQVAGCSACGEMARIEAGSFLMGAPDGEPKSEDFEKPQHRVTLQAFEIGRTVVTQGQWKAVMGDDSNYFKDGGDSLPVSAISSGDAPRFLKKLNQLTKQNYRLPSEAEWEYAARAGSNTAFWWGDSITTDQANYDGNYTYNDGKEGQYREKTVKADSFEANPWGLYVHGKVREWVEDLWHDDYKGAPTDGSAWVSQGDDRSRRVLRGGSRSYIPRNLRPAVCYWYTPVYRNDVSIGFRIARTL